MKRVASDDPTADFMEILSLHRSDHEGDSKIPRILATWGVPTPMGFGHTLRYFILARLFSSFFCWQDMVLKFCTGWVGIAILPVNW